MTDARAGPAGSLRADIDPSAHFAWLGKLSHDLRNQLTPMRTATQLLLSGRLDAGRQQEMLELADRQVTRLTRMLDDLSEYGQLQSGRAAASEDLDLGILVDTALGTCGRDLRDAGITLDQQVPDQRIPLHGQRQRLVQMLIRLLDNARRFTPAGGTVALRIAVEGTQATVRVIDHGAGIEPERLSSIFELPDGPRSSERLGISLMLARACARDHGGDLIAHSEGTGRGSEFSVRLPLKG